MKKLTELFIRLLKRYTWDLGIVVYRTPDIVFHKFLGLDDESYRGKFDKELIRIPTIIMKYIDLIIARYIRTLNKNVNFISMSDHEHKPKEVCYYVNNILLKSNFINLNRKIQESRYLEEISSLRKISLLRNIWYMLPENVIPEIKNYYPNSSSSRRM